MSIKQRIEQYEIGGAVYTVIAEESENVKSTGLDIIKRLVSQINEGRIKSTERICCLEKDGGKEKCQEHKQL